MKTSFSYKSGLADSENMTAIRIPSGNIIFRNDWFQYLLLLIVFALLSVSTAFSQEEIKESIYDLQIKKEVKASDTMNLVNIFDNQIGVRYSNISGYGISLGRSFFNNYTICISGMMIYDQYEKWTDMSKSKIETENKNILYNFGGELQRDLFKFRNTKVYVFVGGSYSVEDNKNTYDNQTDKILAIGVGLGLQWYMDKHFSGFIHFGYKFNSTDSQKNNQPSLERKTELGLGAGFSYHY